jgi:hypothetical protein
VPVESNTWAALRTTVVTGAESAAWTDIDRVLAQMPTATAVSLVIAGKPELVVFIRCPKPRKGGGEV